MANIYMIGDLARHTKYPIDTLNYYLRIGLIKEVGRSERSNYRYFDDSSIEQIKRIQELRMQKVPVKELLRRKENGVL